MEKLVENFLNKNGLKENIDFFKNITEIDGVLAVFTFKFISVMVIDQYWW